LALPKSNISVSVQYHTPSGMLAFDWLRAVQYCMVFHSCIALAIFEPMWWIYKDVEPH